LPDGSSSLTRKHWTGRPLPYLALHREMGFTKHPASPPGLVSSYLTVSPLPRPPKETQAVYFLLHFPRLTTGRR